MAPSSGPAMAALCLVLLLHAGGVFLMLMTEVRLAGVMVFPLVWVLLNGQGIH